MSRMAQTAAIAIAILTVPAAAASADGPAAIGSTDPVGNRAMPPQAAAFLADDPSAGAAALLTASRAGGDRHKLGLPSYRELLGRAWKRRAAAADRRFASGLLGQAPSAKRRASASARPSAWTEFDQAIKAMDTLGGPGGKQSRTLRVATSLDGGCPRLNELGNGYGWAGAGRATYAVTTTERVGRFDLITSVLFDGSFKTRPEMLTNATAASFSSADVGQISITRNQVAVDLRSGKRRTVGETERFNSDLDPYYGPDGDFRSFVAEQEDGAPAPARKLKTGAWKEAAKRFMAIPYDALRSRVLEAERLARTPNACVQAPVEAPSHLTPGQTVELTGVARPSPAIKFAGALRATWINPQGQSAAPLSMIEQVRGGGRWYSFTAPAQPWPDQSPAGLEFELLSGAGIARTPVSFRAEQPRLYFEVLGASIETHTTASRPSALCGEVGGHQTFSGTFAPQPFSPEDRLTLAGGGVSGEVSASVDAVWHDHVVWGCKAADEGPEVCEEAMPDRTPSPDGTWPLGFEFQPADDPGQVTLAWRMDDPEVGFIDAGDAECNAHVWGYFPNEVRRRTIARSELQALTPITLTFAGSGHLDKHGDVDPASIDHDWEYSITIRRVDALGNPLAPTG